MARERGHHETSHVVWIGKSGWKDWDLKRVLLDEDWVLVTKNSEDFRGPREAPGTKGQFADVVLHAGLICLNGPVGMDLALQRELFAEADRPGNFCIGFWGRQRAGAIWWLEWDLNPHGIAPNGF